MTLKDLATKDVSLNSLNLGALLPKGKTLNIEAGDRITKVCVSHPKNGGYQIRNSFLFQTPENAVADGEVTDPDALAAELRKQLDIRGLKDVRNVTFALTSGKVATREVSLPPVRDSRLKDVVQTNAADYFPIDLSGYYVSHCLLDRVEKGEKAGCRVLVFAAPLQVLQSYFRLAEKAGLRIRCIDFSGNSQYQALRDLDGEAVTMYINMDCSSSCVTFLKGREFLLQRTFTFGGDELILSYMSASGKSDYAAALRECSGSDPDAGEDGAVRKADVAESLSRLVGNIVRSVNYFNSSHWDQPVEKVMLLGPCSRLPGLREMVAGGTGLETSYLDTLPAVSSFDGTGDKVSSYISCVGSNIAPIDLVPPQFRSDRKSPRKSGGRSDETAVRDGLVICCICVVITLALSACALLRYSAAAAEKKAVQKQIADLTYTEQTYKTYLEYKAEEDSLKTLASSISSPNDRLTDFIKELEQKMPSQILLLSAACDRDKITMNVTVPNYSDVAVVLVQLRSFQSIRDIGISSVTKQTDQSGGGYVSFSLTCTYGTNPYLNGTNPYASSQAESGKTAPGGSPSASSAAAAAGEAKP